MGVLPMDAGFRIEDIFFPDIETSCPITDHIMPYSHHGIFPEDFLRSLYLERLTESLACSEGLSAALYFGDELTGYVICRPLCWDTMHFGLSMARLEVAFNAVVTDSWIRKIIIHVIEKARSQGIKHISSSIDELDQECLKTMLEIGFDLLDKKVISQGRNNPENTKDDRYSTRPCKKEDEDKIRTIAINSNPPSRFSRDAFLTERKVREMYGKWMVNIAEKSSDGGIFLVSENDRREIVGCGGFLPVVIDKSTSRTLYGQSLLACSREGKGAGRGLISQAMNSMIFGASVEFVTSANNKAMLNLLSRSSCHIVSISNEVRLMI